jgi:hypothetical protein
MDEMGMLYHTEPNKTLSMEVVQGAKINKECITLSLIINCIGMDKLKPIII